MSDLLAVPNAEGVAMLILLDEVLMYARQKVAEDKGWLIKLQAFFQALTQAAVKTDRCAIVASLLASELETDGSARTGQSRSVEGNLAAAAGGAGRAGDEGRRGRSIAAPVFQTGKHQRQGSIAPARYGGVQGNRAHDETMKKQGAEAEKALCGELSVPPGTDGGVLLELDATGPIPADARSLRLFAMALRDCGGIGPVPAGGRKCISEETG